MNESSQQAVDRDWTYPLGEPEAEPSVAAPPRLGPSVASLFSSVKRQGRVSVPPELNLTAAFAELKLDLRDALFPSKHVLIVANSLCASLTVLLPDGAMVEDNSMHVASSHHVSQHSEEHGPVIHLEGWSLFSDVKFITERW